MAASSPELGHIEGWATKKSHLGAGGGIGGQPFMMTQGAWTLTEEDLLLISLLQDPIYAPELCWRDPSNHEYGTCYRVRDYQYPLFRVSEPYAGFACARSVGKTESIKARAFSHIFRRTAENLLLTAPELIHLLPLTDAIEERIQDTRVTREFLDIRNGKSGFTHRPFGAEFLDGTKIVGRIPRLTGTGVKGQHQPDLMIDECFPAGTLVLTKRGQVPIEEVVIGDEVLTHRNRWRRVTDRMKRRRKTIELRGQGHPGFVCSDNHPFWVRKRCEKVLGDPAFVPARELAPAGGYPSDNARREGAHYWSSPTRFPELPIPELPVDDAEVFWWMLGFYLAEGCVSKALRQVTFAVHAEEAEMTRDCLLAMGIESTVIHDPPEKGLGARVTAKGALGKPYAQWLAQHVGRIGEEKQVMPWIHGAPEDIRAAVLAGYIEGDGNFVKDQRYSTGRWQATCVNRKIAMGIQLLAQSLGYFTSLYRWEDQRENSTLPGVRPGRSWYQIRGNRESNQCLVDDGQVFSIVRSARPTGRVQWLYDLTVEDDHSFVAEGRVVSNSQDYPERGWVEVHETVMKDHVDRDGNPDFRYMFYGVHSGARDSGFFKRINDGSFKLVTVTAIQRPGWGKAEKDAAKAAYGGTSNPDYRRNIYGEPGSPASKFFVTARLYACVDQGPPNGRPEDSDYNSIEYVKQELRAEEVSELLMPMRDILDLPAKDYKAVYMGADLGLNDSPTVIACFSHEKVNKVDRLKLFRLYKLHRFTSPKIRETFYALASHFGARLVANGIDATGLGNPIWQEMEADEVAPQRLIDVTRGYFYNAKVPVGLESGKVIEDTRGNLRDQYGTAVKKEVDEWGQDRFVVTMPMIEASTRYLREFVDSGLFMIPFDPEITTDMQGETQQRVKTVGERTKLSKPNAFHILDAFRGMAMGFRAEEVEGALTVDKPVPVLDMSI